jgi:Fe-S oxidoreductase
MSMLPNDEDAKRLAHQTFTFGEFLARRVGDWEMPRLERKALVHFHCHQRATSDTDCDQEVLDRLGLDYEVLDTGCCGLAGSFGYEAGERYEVSMKAGEQVLLPRVCEASPHTLIVTDGFSCHSQIEHGTERRALHLAQVVRMATREGPNGPSTPHPEAAYAEPPAPAPRGAASQGALAAAGAATVGGLGVVAARRLKQRS